MASSVPAFYDWEDTLHALDGYEAILRICVLFYPENAAFRTMAWIVARECTQVRVVYPLLLILFSLIPVNYVQAFSCYYARLLYPLSLSSGCLRLFYSSR